MFRILQKPILNIPLIRKQSTMNSDPVQHNRKSIRLKGWDYSRAGAYYITMCVNHRKCLFGNIVNNEMNLNDAGNMIEKWYFELKNKFPTVLCDEHITMPDHFHAIIIFDSVETPTVGVDLCVQPSHISGEHNVGVDLCVHPAQNSGEHTGSPLRGTTTIPRVMQWFKTMSTNEYIRNVKTNHWPSFNGKLWQRNYYDHIGRNEKDISRIRRYIRDNPLHWDKINAMPSKKPLSYVAMPDPAREGTSYHTSSWHKTF